MSKPKPVPGSRTNTHGAAFDLEAALTRETIETLLREQRRARKIFDFGRMYGAGPRTIRRFLEQSHAIDFRQIEERIFRHYTRGVHDEVHGDPPYQLGRESRLFVKPETCYGTVPAAHPMCRSVAVPFLWAHNADGSISLDTETTDMSKEAFNVSFSPAKPIAITAPPKRRKLEAIARDIRKLKAVHAETEAKISAAREAVRTLETKAREEDDRLFFLHNELHDAI